MEEVVKTGSLLVYDPNRLSATAELRFFFMTGPKMGNRKKKKKTNLVFVSAISCLFADNVEELVGNLT